MDSSSPQVPQTPTRRGLALAILPESFGICKLHPRARLPRWIFRSSSFYTVTRTRDELSIVAREDLIPQRFPCDRDWRAMQVIGPLDFALVGIVAALSLPLARAGVSLFTVSSYDTDFLLVRAKNLDKAKAALEAAGHVFRELPAAASQAALPEDEEEGDEDAEPEAPTAPPARQRAELLAESELPKSEPPQSDEAHRPGAPFSTSFAAVAAAAAAPAAAADPFNLPAAPATPWSSEVFAEPRTLPFALGGFEIEDPEKAEASAEAQGPSADGDGDVIEVEAVEISVTGDVIDVEAVEVDAIEVDAIEVEAAEPDSAETVEPATSFGAAPRMEKPAFESEPLPRPDAVAQSFVPATEEPLPADEIRGAYSDEDDDREVDAEGLYTGAIPQHDVEITEDAFESLGVSSAILDTVRGIGFTNPTPIQAAIIPLALEGGDLIGLAQTGSGKTAAFCLPLAERLTHGRGLRGLILCPTREIALQTKAFLDIFGREHSLRTALIIGGVNMAPQIEALRRQPDIVVATPGRLCDHLRRGNIRLGAIEELVLDEADHMLDLGFLPQIQEVLESLPSSRRTMMFSATMPPPIERLAQRFMRDPYMVDLRPVGSVASGIEHRLYLVREDDKKRCLIELLNQVPGSTLIFTRRKLHAEYLARQLETAGLPVDRIHSDRTQAQRVRALRGFREGRFRILVATDVAARGIDVPRLQHVINFGPPEGVDDYIHRAGRTARGSAVGTVSTIGTWLDKPIIREIETTLGLTIPRHEAPGVEAYKEIKRRPEIRRRRLL